MKTPFSLCLLYLFIHLTTSALSGTGDNLQPLNTPGKITNHPEQNILPFNAPCSDCKEDLSKRTGMRREFYKVEAGGSKTFHVQQSLGAMSYRDNNGYWLTIDPMLKKESETVYAARQQPSSVVIDFGNKYTSLKYAGHEFRFNKNISLAHVSSAGIETTLGEGDWSRIQQSVNYTQTIFTLQDFYPGIDLQFVTGEGTVESSFIIRNKQQYTDGWLVMKQGLEIPSGLKADNSVAIPDESGKRKGMLLLKDSNNENCFYFNAAHAYDAQGSGQNYVEMPYVLDVDKLSHFVPVQWLNDPSTVYPIVLDPLVITSDSLSIYAIRGSGFTTVCDTMGCSYFMNNFVMPANSEIMDIRTYLSYIAIFPCVRTEGGFEIAMTSSIGSCASGHFSCPGGIQGQCFFWPVSLLIGNSSFTSCVPSPQCSPYTVDFRLDFRRCNWIPVAGCDSTCIASNSPWVMEVSGRTSEIATVTLPQVICEGSCVDIAATSQWGVEPYTYTWQPGNLTGDVVNVCPTSTTTYFLTVTDSCGSTDTASTTVTVLPAQNPGFSIFPDDSVCGGTQMTFTANSTAPDSLFSWIILCPSLYAVQDTKVVSYPAQVNPGLCTATMMFEVNDSSNTCFISETDTFYVTTGLPFVDIVYSPSMICAGDSITFSALLINAPTPDYGWFINSSLVSIDSTFSTTTLSSSDTIMLRIISSGACGTDTAYDALMLTVNPDVIPQVTVTCTEDTICVGTFATFTASVLNAGSNPAYQWLVNGTSVAGEDDSTFTTGSLLAGDIVSVVITSSELCADPPSLVQAANVFIDNCMGIGEHSLNTFSMHPNPATNELTIIFAAPAHKNVFIFDMMGQELFSTDLAGQDQLKIDVSDFARAVYFVKVSEKDGWNIQRLVLK